LSLVLRLTRYLWYAEETTSRRVRAIAISVVLLLVVPTGVMWIPIQSNVYAAGVTRRAGEIVVRAATPGFVEQVFATPGESVKQNAPLARLVNDATVEQLAEVEARLRASDVRRDAFREDRPARLAEEQAAAVAIQVQLDDVRTRIEALSVTAPICGDVVQVITQDNEGAFLKEGDPIATIGAGPWEVRTVLTSEQLAAVDPRAGTVVLFRAVNDPARIIHGRVVQIVPAGSQTVAIEALTHLGGRDIAVDPATHRAIEPYFELIATLDDAPEELMCVGLTGEIRLDGQREPIGFALVRRAVRFWHKLRRD